MAKCPYCGSETVDGAKFCGSCGNMLSAAAEEPVWEQPAEEAVYDEPAEETVYEEAPGESYEEPAGEGYYQEPAAEDYYEEAGGYYAEPNSDYEQPPEDGYYDAPAGEEDPQYYGDAGVDYGGEGAGNKNAAGEALQKAADAVVPAVKKAAGAVGPALSKFFGTIGGACGKISKRAAILAAAGVAGLAVVVAVCLFLWNNRSPEDYALYLKDGELYYSDFSKKGPLEVTSQLIGGNSGTNHAAAYRVGSSISFSEDGKRIFFPDKLDTADCHFVLYYRDVTKPKEDAEKIDSDIYNYSINAAGDKVVYLKGDSGTLYFTDLEKEEKIDKDVISYEVAGDLESVWYDTEEALYTWSMDQEPEEVREFDEDETFLKMTEDFSAFFYLKDGNLYREFLPGGDREEIASDISQIVKLFDSGEVYFTRSETVEHKYMDFVDDDLKASDAAMTEPAAPEYPEAPKYPRKRDYEDDEAYNDAKKQYNEDYEAYAETCDQIRAAYTEAYELYKERVARDYMREALEEKVISYGREVLYFYDGTTETMLTEDYCQPDYSVTPYGGQKAAALDYLAYDRSDLPRFKVSELNASSEVGDGVYAELYSTRVQNLAIGAVAVEIEEEGAASFRYPEDESAVYFLADITDSGEGDLYKVTVDNGQPGEPERIETDVVLANWWTEGEDLFCYKDYDAENVTVSLYRNGEEVDSDVYMYNRPVVSGGKIYYIADWRGTRETGTLRVWEKDEAKDIAEDVTDFALSKAEDLLYLGDYRAKRGEGSLYRYTGGKPKLVDEDVSRLIRLQGDEVRGY